jgi:ankyrin repeat protein
MENKQVNEKLMAAVITGDIEAATEAIIAGADIHQKTVKGNNLLYVAASRMQEDMFDWLLEVEVKDKKN